MSSENCGYSISVGRAFTSAERLPRRRCRPRLDSNSAAAGRPRGSSSSSSRSTADRSAISSAPSWACPLATKRSSGARSSWRVIPSWTVVAHDDLDATGGHTKPVPGEAIQIRVDHDLEVVRPSRVAGVPSGHVPGDQRRRFVVGDGPDVQRALIVQEPHSGVVDRRSALDWCLLYEVGEGRRPLPDSFVEPAVDIEQVSVWDLLEAFDSIMAETGSNLDMSHISDDTPIDLYQIEILHRLQSEGPLRFARIFESKANRAVMVGLFLALLELVRAELVWAEQGDGSTAIHLKALTDEPAEQAVQRAIEAGELEARARDRKQGVDVFQVDAADAVAKKARYVLDLQAEPPSEQLGRESGDQTVEHERRLQQPGEGRKEGPHKMGRAFAWASARRPSGAECIARRPASRKSER